MSFSNYKKFENVGIRSSNDTLIVMDSSNNNISLHSSDGGDTNVDTLSIKNIINKTPNMDLNLSSLNGNVINPVITINNNNGDCRIMTNLNVNGNVNINNNLIIPTHNNSNLLSNVKGSIYFNTTENMYEGYVGDNEGQGWQPLGGFSKTKDATIHKNLNVNGNINLTNEGMIKTTGIGSFGSIHCGVGTFTSIDSGSITATGNSSFGSITTSGGITNSGGEILISGGNLQLNDNRNLSFGTDDDTIIKNDGSNFLIQNTTSGGNITIDNQDNDKKIIMKLGTNNIYTSFEVQDSYGVAHLYVNGNGEVGIGKSNPNHKLDVNGNVSATNFYGTIAASNVSGTVSNATRAENLGGYYASSDNNNNYIVQRDGSGNFKTSAITFNAQNYCLNFGTSGTWRGRLGANGTTGYKFHIDNAGDTYECNTSRYHAFYTRVGINTSSPGYTLEVKRSGTSGTAPDQDESYGYMNSAGTATESSSWAASTYSHIVARFRGYVEVDDYIMVFAQNWASDTRIKTNIVDVPDNLALEQLRNIPCRYYEYIDKTKRGSNKTIGFIAQEVKTILPMAIKTTKNIIPDVYKIINCTWTNVDDKFNMSSTDLSNVNGIKYKFYVSNTSDYSDEKEIELTGNSDNTFTFDTQYTNVFCYGSEVDDFHTVDKAKLFALNFSATQEIDRIQQTHITEIASLKIENQQQQTKINTLETEVSTLKTENAELKSIIDKLKTANSFEEFKNSL